MRWFRVGALQAFAAGTAFCAAAVLLGAGAAQQNHAREALWDIVHNLCVPDQLQSHDPKPCTKVDLTGGVEQGYAILKDLRGVSQYLLIATAQIQGVESPELLAPKAPNYFADAWEERDYIGKTLHRALPREDISLAINSTESRSQDQLHIHMDCVSAEVRASLYLHRKEIGEHWAPFPNHFFGHPYMALWVAGEKLGANNPFKLVAEGVPGAAGHMGDQTLVVIGATRADGMAGFVILEDQANRVPGDTGSGEELQDHGCRVALEEKSEN